MTISGENAIAPRLESSRPDVPAREVVVTAFFGPLANAVVALLLPLRVPPPAVVLANAAAGLLAALALTQGELVVAAVLLQLKTVLDNADGRLARVSGRASLLGRYLDTEADFVVNAVFFAALGSLTGQPWLALAGFAALTLLLSVDFNLVQLYREEHAQPQPPPPPTGSPLERTLAHLYRAVFAPQDRLVRALSERRLERLLRGEPDPARRREATLAYHDCSTLAVLANLGLSTQLVALGVCLAVDAPAVYLWLVLAQMLVLPALQLRRERLARRALRA